MGCQNTGAGAGENPWGSLELHGRPWAPCEEEEERDEGRCPAFPQQGR